MYETDGGDESGSGYREVLDEISRLRTEIHNKYRNYLEEEKYDLLMKQLGILEYETKVRMQMLFQYYQNTFNNGKSR